MLGNSKGLSTSVWIWIVGGLVVALLTFTVTFQSLVNVGNTSARNNVVDQFGDIRNTARLYCMRGEGSLTTKTVSLSGVRAVYAADSKGNPDPRVPNYISEGQTNTGKYMCLKFENSANPYNCVKMRCQVNMTYIGKPLKGSDMYILGRKDGSFEFKLTIKKLENQLRINASHVP
ncbi:MAG: hypothetical protein ABEJ87_01585 [Candidatus Nanohalobium sp.]